MSSPVASSVPDGRFPDGRLPDARFPDGRLPDGRFPDAGLPDGNVLDRLRLVCQVRGQNALADRLGELSRFVHTDLEDFEAAISSLPTGSTLVHRGAHRILELGGKRLRPLCVLLAARVGTGMTPQARDLAVAVELVHCATLLHDDVVDLSDLRRGAPTARVMYGNAASIFAGDWLLVEALRLVRHSHVPGALDRLLDTIEEMIFAESLQLQNRGRINADPAAYLKVIEGKTAALFRWAMYAGSRAGELDHEQGLMLEQYGLDLGIAFQIVDDLLDFTGDPAITGKALFTDLREGKMTWPLIVGVQHDGGLLPVLEEVVALPPGVAPSEAMTTRIASTLTRPQVLDACLELAREHVARAIGSLETLPPGPGRGALATVAEAAVARDR